MKMLRKISFFSFIICSLFSCGGDSTINSENSASFEEESVLSYDDISEFKIAPSDMYSQKENLYLVYFYSKFCPSCNSMKELLISNIKEFTTPLYIVDISDNSYSFDSMPFLKETNLSENKKINGSTTIEETPFSQAPCMYQIENNALTYWVNNYSSIYTFFNTKNWTVLS